MYLFLKTKIYSLNLLIKNKKVFNRFNLIITGKIKNDKKYIK